MKEEDENSKVGLSGVWWGCCHEMALNLGSGIVAVVALHRFRVMDLDNSAK